MDQVIGIMVVIVFIGLLADKVLFSPHPGRIREEFTIPLPRPRDINSVDLAEHATEIMRALKGHLRATEVQE